MSARGCRDGVNLGTEPTVPLLMKQGGAGQTSLEIAFAISDIPPSISDRCRANR
jgi:hypothetical protein